MCACSPNGLFASRPFPLGDETEAADSEPLVDPEREREKLRLMRRRKGEVEPFELRLGLRCNGEDEWLAGDVGVVSDGGAGDDGCGGEVGLTSAKLASMLAARLSVEPGNAISLMLDLLRSSLSVDVVAAVLRASLASSWP